MRKLNFKTIWQRFGATRRRRGSILILVVSVLVLLALMGTAYISTARLDRQAAAPANEATTDEVIEQLIPTVSGLIQDAIKRDVYITSFGYRSPADTTFENWDYPGVNWIGASPNKLSLKNDAFLASRLPEYVPVSNLGTRSAVWAWLSLTRPLNQPDGVTNTGDMKRFETPYVEPIPATAKKRSYLEHYPEYTQDQNIGNDVSQMFMVPADLSITYPATADPALAGKTRVFPALVPYKQAGFAPTQQVMTVPQSVPPRPLKFLAADADGDGAADAGLCYLTTVDGIRYYYATRIIDNNSAININTARSMRGDFSGTSATVDTPPNWIFPSSVGLLELLLPAPGNSYNATSAEMDALNRFMWNIPTGPIAAPLQPVQDPIDPTGTDDPAPTNRNDFTFTRQGEAVFFQSDRRVDNPGFRLAGPAPAPGAQDTRVYQPFELDSNVNLFYRFGMMDPSATTPVANSVDYVLELANVADPIYRAAPNYASPANPLSLASRYRFIPPAEPEFWFQYNYNLDKNNPDRAAYFSSILMPEPKQPLRSLMTTHNPVSNRTVGQAQAINSAMLPYGAKGRWHDQFEYAVGDVCIHMPANQPPALVPQTYLYVATGGSGPSTVPPQTATTVAPGWARVNPRGIWDATPAPAYAPGDLVHHTIAGSEGTPTWDLYVHTGGGNASPETGAPWIKLSGYQSSPRASLNTGTFGELFRAFFNVMAEDNTAGPPAAFLADMTGFATAAPAGYVAGNTTPGTIVDPYVGNRFHTQLQPPGPNRYPFDPIITGDLEFGALPGGTNTHPMKMFRSPIRSLPNLNAPHYDASMRRLTAQSVMQLRAALAAVNAIDARDSDLDVTSRRLQLYAVQGGGTSVPGDFLPVDVTVYGQEAQPFITEVFANTDTTTDIGFGVNPQGYVAIELYNPYPFDIPMTEWRLAIINRLGEGMTGQEPLQPQDLAVRELVNFGPTGTAPIVPARGYLLLENYDPTGGATAGAATYRPAATGLPATGPLAWAQSGTTASSGPATSPPQVNVAFLPLPDASLLPQIPPATIFNQEMVLLKRRQFNGAPTTILTAAEQPGIGPVDESIANPNHLRDMIPVDSFDFTGLVLSDKGHAWPEAVSPVVGQAQSWHYVRASNEETGLPTKNWHFVYPGRYDATTTVTTPWNAAGRRPRQAGTDYSLLYDPATQRDEWDPGDLNGTAKPTPDAGGTGRRPLTETTLGASYPLNTVQTTNASPVAGYHTTFPVQLGFGNFHEVATLAPGGSIGHNPVLTTGTNAFPYGGFSRAGDVLHVPFIGSYVITRSDPGLYPAPNPINDPLLTGGSTYVIEMNSVTMDAAMAEDTDVNGDPQYDLVGTPIDTGLPTQAIEQLGRFVPGTRVQGAGLTNYTLFHYSWAADVLDQFTAIHNAHDDFLPNVDPALYPAASPPRGVANVNGAFANTEQDFDAATQGLININTASWKVLASLPLVVDAGANVQTGDVGAGVTGSGTVNLNQALAQAIVYFRDIDSGNGKPYGPFTSLFELNAVIDSRPGGLGTTFGFQNMMRELNVAAGGADPGDGQGDFTPHNSSNGVTSGRQLAEDGVRLDYEEKNLNIIRLSNLLTTRSDTFTCYLVVQGWKDAGTAFPQLVAERRAAFVVDRSAMSSNNATMTVKSVPAE